MPGRITSPYGMRKRPSGPRMHQGIDIAAPEGTPVFAALGGVVTHATGNGARGFSNYGKTVVIKHPGGWWTLYAHLSGAAVRPGQTTQQGELIGYVGRTRGYFDKGTRKSVPDFFHTSGSHLHFETRSRSLPAAYGAGNVDPAQWLAARGLPLPTTPQGRPVPATPAPLPSGGTVTRKR